MRAFIRMIPLVVAAAQMAACAANTIAPETPGAARYAAMASQARPAARKPPTARPSQALLVRQPSPRCERAQPLQGVPADQARAAMLDYEQQCYKQLAEIAHARLATLQDAAPKTGSFESRHRPLLEREPAPRCEPAQGAAGLSPAAAREATLDAARQCYKQLEAGARHKLEALQDALRKTAGTARAQRGETQRARRARYMTY